MYVKKDRFMLSINFILISFQGHQGCYTFTYETSEQNKLASLGFEVCQMRLLKNYPRFVNQISFTSYQHWTFSVEFNEISSKQTYSIYIIANTITKLQTCRHYTHLFPYNLVKLTSSLATLKLMVQATSYTSMIILGTCFLLAPKMHYN